MADKQQQSSFFAQTISQFVSPDDEDQSIEEFCLQITNLRKSYEDAMEQEKRAEKQFFKLQDEQKQIEYQLEEAQFYNTTMIQELVAIEHALLLAQVDAQMQASESQHVQAHCAALHQQVEQTHGRVTIAQQALLHLVTTFDDYQKEQGSLEFVRKHMQQQVNQVSQQVHAMQQEIQELMHQQQVIQDEQNDALLHSRELQDRQKQMEDMLQCNFPYVIYYYFI